MPVIRDIPLSLETKEVLRREGIKEYSRLMPEMRTLIGELLASQGGTGSELDTGSKQCLFWPA